jgi:uroporphyrinogen decarboxylase
MGHPHRESWPALVETFGTEAGSTAGAHETGADRAITREQKATVRRFLGDDFAWIPPGRQAYHHPDGQPMFDIGRAGDTHNAPGRFAETESVDEVEAAPWPDPDHLDFADCLAELDAAGTVYRAGGMWTPFFHLVADFFGMDNYFIKMYTHPDVVHAVTRRVVDFYLEANRRLFEQAGDRIDGFFFGNDFGTQLDLLIGPEQFREFVFPYFRQLTDLGHRHGMQVILHSCGSIYKVIPDLIELGVDALHPLQAKAANMGAERLGTEFRGALAFIGGIDTQDLLVNASAEEVKADVARVASALGPRLVVSPSHEALLPNVPPENVLAMSEAARVNRPGFPGDPKL